MKQISIFALFCFLILGKTTAQTNPFENEIKAFEAKDSINKPIAGQILLYGSSTLRRWESYEADFKNKNLKVVNRGFGGSQGSDANLFFDRVVVPQQPKYIFYYEGDNDINAGKSVETAFEDYKTFVKKVKKQLPKTRIVFFAIKPSPSRILQFDKQKEFNVKVWQWTQKEKGLYFIDTFNRMLGSDGKPDPKLFKADMLHMNADGYAIWKKEVQKFLNKREK